MDLNNHAELGKYTIQRLDYIVETMYGRMRYIIKDGTKNKMILQQEHIERWSTGEVKRKWISVPLELQ